MATPAPAPVRQSVSGRKHTLTPLCQKPSWQLLREVLMHLRWGYAKHPYQRSTQLTAAPPSVMTLPWWCNGRSPHWASGGWGATCPPLDRLVDGHRRGFPEADVGVVAPKLELHGVVDGGHEASDDVVGAAGAADNGDLLVAEGGVRGFGSRRSEEAPAV
uniref:Uncharacterized protein n=1 Tax=Oryza nivara TaxID=4536 RepID=A0A0E0GXF8_ORYNI